MPTAVATAPCLSLTAQDVAATVNALEAYQAIYSPLLARREQRSQLALYWRGLLAELPRKSIEPIVLRLHGADLSAVRTLQTFVNQGAWDDNLLLRRHWQEVELDLGCEQGVLIVDGSDFPKQGPHSVGVKRQYCGELGKRANCQAGVFVSYASAKGYTLLHRRLYLPEEWLTDDAFTERRERCGIPAETRFATKPELALEMLREVTEAGTLRCRWLAADEAFGRDTAFLDGVAGLGLWYFAEVPHDTQVWLERPLTGLPEWSGRGRKPKRERVLGGASGQTVAVLAEPLEASEWRLRLIQEGSQGPQEAEFASRRVVGGRAGLPGPEVWLVWRRNPVSGELKTYLSNAPVETSELELARLSGMRWPVEMCFTEGKQLLGMGSYELRSWVGWHHHQTLVLLAHFFVVRTSRELKKSTGSDVGADGVAAGSSVAA